MDIQVQTNETSPGNRAALADSWIEKLFQKFEDFYGAKWAAAYGSFPRDRVKRTWAEELGGFASMPECLAMALDDQKLLRFPPTLPEFLALCREAAKRRPPKELTLLGHKLTEEDMQRNRERITKIANGLGRRMTE